MSEPLVERAVNIELHLPLVAVVPACQAPHWVLGNHLRWLLGSQLLLLLPLLGLLVTLLGPLPPAAIVTVPTCAAAVGSMRVAGAPNCCLLTGRATLG